MDERFEQEIEEELESLRQQVRFLEQQIAATKPSKPVNAPQRDVVWNGLSGTLGGIAPKISDLRGDNNEGFAQAND
jgi:hypothetical protein